MKDDEKLFMMLIHYHKEKYNRTPREVINNDVCTINYKRCWYLLNKWSSKNLYEYGVTLDMGWLTKEGREKATELIDEFKALT